VVAEEGGGAVDAGPDQQVTIGETVTLHGSTTLSCGSDHAWWDWNLTSKPATSRVAVYGASDRVQFLPDTVGTYVVGLEVSCGSLRETDEVVVEVVPPSGGGEASVLGYRAVDAEMSRSLDKVVLVSEGPATLHLVDPADGTETTVALPQKPSAVSVSPDGREAAVGHDGWVSLVDLDAMRVTATWPAGVNVGDVVHGGNGWVYAFPAGSGFDPVRGIEIATGRQVQSPANTMAGNWARRLSATELLSVRTGDLFRIDLAADGTPSIAWRWYDFDHDPGAKFWVAADGARIFGTTGEAFWLGDGTADGVSYAGSLSGYRPIHLDHAGGIGRIALVGTGASTWERTSDVVLLEDVYLAEREVLTLPWIEYDGAWKQLFGRYVFFDAAGSRLVVVADMNSSTTTFPGDPTGPDVLVRIAL
jgi:hypothetical protein